MSNISKVYLLGIGGIGMSGLARYFKRQGCTVAGYDRTPSSLTRELEDEGIDLLYRDDPEAIPEVFREEAERTGPERESTLVIYTPAVPAGTLVLDYFRQRGYPLRKRSEVLGMLSRDMQTVAIAGTHGKTSTSAMTAHILTHSGYGCSAFVGGIMVNYGTNVLFGEGNTLVVEADEYDRSFLTLHPDLAAVTSMDADHLDIYGNKESLEEAFALFAGQLKEGGLLVKKVGLPLARQGLVYALEGGAGVEAWASRLRTEDGNNVFDYEGMGVRIENIRMIFPGKHNVENAVAAISLALQLGISPEKIKAALESFRGVRRRFEYIIRKPEQRLIFIDDYAHHPRELKACIGAARALYPGLKLTLVFQPHLYSRTRDFADEFAEALSHADELILLDIYPARELPIEGIDSRFLLDKVPLEAKRLLSKEELPAAVKAGGTELLITAGAGDIDRLVEPLKEHLLQ